MLSDLFVYVAEVSVNQARPGDHCTSSNNHETRLGVVADAKATRGCKRYWELSTCSHVLACLHKVCMQNQCGGKDQSYLALSHWILSSGHSLTVLMSS